MQNEKVKEFNDIIKKIKKKEPISIGDTIYGEILVLKDNLVVVGVSGCMDSKKVLSPADMGVIFVKNIDSKYIESTQDCFSKGDIILAKVSDVSPYEYKLVTNYPELGVIKGHCKKCKQTLDKKAIENDGKIKCLNCGTIQTKKFAKLVE